MLVVSHVPPDGDGLGAGLALVRALTRLGRRAVFAAGGPVQKALASFARDGEIDTSRAGPPGNFDCAVAFDAADDSRLGPLAARCRAAPVFLNVDHHETNTRFGTHAFVDPASPAVGEMTRRILAAMGVPLDADLALPLWLAIVTDTGRFGYSNTTPDALRCGADLLAAGASPQEVTDRLYRSAPGAYLRLLGRALASLEIVLDGLVAHTTVTADMLRETGADPLDAGDVVDYPISVLGVEVGVLFRPAGDGAATKVSLRSRHYFPVSAFAARFGGGGHPRAAGATIPLPLEAARQAVLAELLPAVRAAAEAAS